jgi:hypothetical protein
LTSGQIAALKTIAGARDPESYIAGSTPLNRSHARYSADIDIFHDREERVAQAAQQDADALSENGFSIRWLRRSGAVQSIVATRDEEDVRLEWVADSDFRYFPTVPDSLFGYVLHPIDLAMNKALAAANRRELRDVIDLVAIHETILPLGAVTWAAVEKSPGYTPEGLIDEIRRNSIHPAEEWRRLAVSAPVDAAATLGSLRTALGQAETFVKRMPSEKAGLLFIAADGKVVQPDPDRLSEYTTHSGRRRGHWPSSPEIAAAMMEQYR